MRDLAGEDKRVTLLFKEKAVNGAETGNDRPRPPQAAPGSVSQSSPPSPPASNDPSTPHVFSVAATRRAAGAQQSPTPGRFCFDWPGRQAILTRAGLPAPTRWPEPSNSLCPPELDRCCRPEFHSKFPVRPNNPPSPEESPAPPPLAPERQTRQRKPNARRKRIHHMNL